MEKIIKENELMEKRELRETLINEDRLEILDKVKLITTLGDTNYSTVEQVAEYYNVGKEAINSIVKRNREELTSNGLKSLKRNELADIFESSHWTFKSGKGKTEVFNKNISFNVTNTGLNLFNKRTILNVGMLLDKSEVAKEVRTMLLDNHSQLKDTHEKLKNGEKIDIDKTNPEYFINTELKLREQEKNLKTKMTDVIIEGDMDSYLAISCQVNSIKEQLIKLEKEKIELLKPKADFHDSVNDTSGTIKVGDFAKLLTKKGFKIGQNTLFKWLRENKILMDGRNKNKPYQQYLDKGYFEVKETVIHKEKNDFITFTTKITGSGQVFLEKKLRKELKEVKTA